MPPYNRTPDEIDEMFCSTVNHTLDAPPNLLAPHGRAASALEMMGRFGKIWEEVKEVLERQPSDEARRQLSAATRTWLTQQPSPLETGKQPLFSEPDCRSLARLARSVAELWNDALIGGRSLDPVAVPFAAVASGPAKFQGLTETSMHQAVIGAARQHVRSIVGLFLQRCQRGSAPAAWNVGRDILKGVSAEDVLDLLAKKPWPTDRLSTVVTGVDASMVDTVKVELQQELLRASRNDPSATADHGCPEPGAGMEVGAAGSATVKQPHIAVSLNPPQVTIDGKAYALNRNAAKLLQAIVDADGEWVAASACDAQAARTINGMPPEVRRLIESKPGAGTRLKRKRP